jgi:hypothetical protein
MGLEIYLAFLHLRIFVGFAFEILCLRVCI